MSEIKLIVRPFAMGTEKEAALKPLEEAAEVYSAWQELDKCGSPEQCRNCDLPNPCAAPYNLADELADTIQASCNLAARYNLDLQSAMIRCEHRNRARGRYPMEDEDAKPCGIRDGHDCNCGGSCGDTSLGVGYLREKSPEEMSFNELFETLRFAIDNHSSVSDCRKIIGLKWCEGNYDCRTCRQRLLDLLKAAHEREVASLEYEKSYYKEKVEAYERDYDDAMRRITDLAHERDGLRRRLEELSDAGITSLHRLLRETLGEAKNVTDNARVYIDKKQESKDEHCGNCGSVWRDHGGDCGTQCAGEHLLPVEPPAQEMSERERVLERLRKIDFAQESVSLGNIGSAVLGYEPNVLCDNERHVWWDNESRAALRDKLIELIGGVNDA